MFFIQHYYTIGCHRQMSTKTLRRLHVLHVATFLHFVLFPQFTGSSSLLCLNADGRRADTSFPGFRCPSWWPIPAPRSSIQSTCHSCLWQDMKKWILNCRCILTAAAAILREREAYLQLAASISFMLEKGRQAWDRVEDNVPRQKSVWCSHLLTSVGL